MRRKYKDRKRQKTDARTVHTRDSFQNPLTRTGAFMPNALEATQYPLTRFTGTGRPSTACTGPTGSSAASSTQSLRTW